MLDLVVAGNFLTMTGVAKLMLQLAFLFLSTFRSSAVKSCALSDCGRGLGVVFTADSVGWVMGFLGG